MEHVTNVLVGPPIQDDPEESEVIAALADYFDNGGKNPATGRDMKLVMRALKETRTTAVRGVNTSRRNQAGLWVLGTALVILTGIEMAIRHNDLVLINLAHVAGGLPPIHIFP